VEGQGQKEGGVVGARAITMSFEGIDGIMG